MFDKSAIEALSQAAAINQACSAIQIAQAGRGATALPDDFQIHDLEKFMPTRRRARGAMETSSVTDFAAYVAQHTEAGTTVFVSHRAMVANAVLNLGTVDAPGHSDNRAQIKPDMTAAYTAMRQIAQGQDLQQARVAEFLEDWPAHLKCFNGDNEISLKHAIAAVRNITIEGLRKVEASEEQLSASKSSFESIKATSRDPLPTTIYFVCVPYQGFESRTFVMRLGIRTTDKPAITLRIVNSELHDEEMAQELAAKVRSAIGDSCPVLIGDYTSK